MADDLACREALAAIWRPQTLQIRMGFDPDVLEAARFELVQRAVKDANRCCGYFPALAGRPGIIHDLPACQRFEAAHPEIETSGFVLRFSFIRIYSADKHSTPRITSTPTLRPP